MKEKVCVQVWMLGRDGTGSQHQLPAAAASFLNKGGSLTPTPDPHSPCPMLYLPCAHVSNINPSARLSRINYQTYAVIPAL